MGTDNWRQPARVLRRVRTRKKSSYRYSVVTRSSASSVSRWRSSTRRILPEMVFAAAESDHKRPVLVM